jgi:uncharacterized protein (UPF0179 family)
MLDGGYLLATYGRLAVVCRVCVCVRCQLLEVGWRLSAGRSYSVTLGSMAFICQLHETGLRLLAGCVCTLSVA